MIESAILWATRGSGRRSVVSFALVLAAISAAPLAPTEETKAAAQEVHLLIISGLGGDPVYRAQFVDWGTKLVTAARAAGVPEANITFLAESPEAAPSIIDGRSTRVEVERVIGEIDRRATAQDQVMIVLIGHGGGTGPASRVSLAGGSATGGSLAATDYARLLAELSPRRIAFVNLASGSGDFVPALAGEGRVIVTATRSATQRNAPLFGGHFVEAFAGSGADLDRDNRVSILEAFEFARQQTERHYREAGLLASEAAKIEDRAGGEGVLLPMEGTEVGAVASRFFLRSSAPTASPADPAIAARLRELYAEQDRIENSVADLTRRSGSMEAQAYQAALQPLLIELARLGQEIRRIEGTP